VWRGGVWRDGTWRGGYRYTAEAPRRLTPDTTNAAERPEEGR
jgi:hypothetical protein